MKIRIRFISSLDPWILGSSILLLLFGLLMIYSTSLESNLNLFKRQLVFAIIGLPIMFFLTFYDYKHLKKATGIIYLVTLLSLIFVLFVGENIRGSTRWINVGFFNLQPAEFAKLAMVIIMAKFLDEHGEKLKNLKYVALSGIYVFLPVVLILIEPDLGTSLVLFFTWFAMLMFSRMDKKQLALLILCFVILSVFSWFFVLHDYQKARIYTFLDPSQDPSGQGYNIIQAIIAVGSGSLWGRGIGRGLQSQLEFLPERQTDFIFASTSEETGFLGSLFVISLFAIIFYRLILLTKSSRDNFGMYLSLGIFFIFFIQALINIGMNIGLLPITGIPLPLLSYGGRSLITTLAALGLAQSVALRRRALHFG